MAKSKELIGLIVGFATGTFLGAMFMSFGRTKVDKKKEKELKKELAKEFAEAAV